MFSVSAAAASEERRITSASFVPLAGVGSVPLEVQPVWKFLEKVTSVSLVSVPSTFTHTSKARSMDGFNDWMLMLQLPSLASSRVTSTFDRTILSRAGVDRDVTLGIPAGRMVRSHVRVTRLLALA